MIAIVGVCVLLIVCLWFAFRDAKYDLNSAKATIDRLTSERAALLIHNSDLREKQKAAGTVINEVHHALDLAAGHIGQQLYSR